MQVCFNSRYSVDDGTVHQMWNGLLIEFCFSPRVKKIIKKRKLRSVDRIGPVPQAKPAVESHSHNASFCVYYSFRCVIY